MARARVSSFFLSCANFGVSGWLLYATESGVEAPQEVIRRWPQAGGCITRVSLKTEVYCVFVWPDHCLILSVKDSTTDTLET